MMPEILLYHHEKQHIIHTVIRRVLTIARHLVNCADQIVSRETDLSLFGICATLPARNLLFLAPLHSPRLRVGSCISSVGAQAALRFRHLAKHRRLRKPLDSVKTLLVRVVWFLQRFHNIQRILRLVGN